MLSRLTFRRRLTVLFALAYFAVSAVLVGVSYTIVRDRLSGGPVGGDAQGLAEEFGVEAPALPRSAPPVVVTSDGRSLVEVIEDVRDEVVSDTLDTLVLWSTLAAVGVGGVALAVGYYIAGRALRPVKQVTETALHLSDTNLSARVNYSGPRDELAVLADTFDAMLDRIQATIDGQRQFTAIASHELRTPLARIRAAADVSRNAPADTTVVELADTVGPAAIQAAHLVERLMQLTRSQAGLVDPGPVRLGPIWVRQLDEARHEAELAGVAVDLHADEVVVEGDPVLMASLARNVIENAVRHNRPGGYARFAVSANADCAEIVAENSGPPLDDADVARISEPFQRDATNPDQIGHGLGTTIIRTIVRAHEGELELTPGPEGGLAVRIRLPVQKSYRTGPKSGLLAADSIA